MHFLAYLSQLQSECFIVYYTIVMRPNYLYRVVWVYYREKSSTMEKSSNNLIDFSSMHETALLHTHNTYYTDVKMGTTIQTQANVFQCNHGCQRSDVFFFSNTRNCQRKREIRRVHLTSHRSCIKWNLINSSSF